MVEAADSVFFVEQVIWLIQFCSLCDIGGCIISIEIKDLLSKSKSFEHILKGICHCDICVRLKIYQYWYNIKFDWHTSGSSIIS